MASHQASSERRPRLLGFSLLLMLAMAVSTFVQLAFGPLGPILVQIFDLSRLQFGLLSAAVFSVGAVLGPRLGRVSDILEGIGSLRALFALSCLPILGLAVAPNYAALLAVAAVAGALSAAGNPVTNRLLADHVPSEHQGLMTGVKQSGVQVGGFIAASLLPVGAVLIGWRWAVAGMLVLPLTGVVLARKRVLPGLRSSGSPEPGAVTRVPLDSKRATLLAWYSLLMGAGIAPVQIYLPLYAFERLGFSVPLAGLTVAVVAIAGFLSRLIWTYRARRLPDLGPSLLVMSGMASAAALLLLCAEPLDARLVWIGATGLGATGMAWNALVMLLVVREGAPGDTGRLSGLVVRGFFVGLLLGPPAAGYVVDATEHYAAAWLLTALLFASATFVARNITVAAGDVSDSR